MKFKSTTTLVGWRRLGALAPVAAALLLSACSRSTEPTAAKATGATFGSASQKLVSTVFFDDFKSCTRPSGATFNVGGTATALANPTYVDLYTQLAVCPNWSFAGQAWPAFYRSGVPYPLDANGAAGTTAIWLNEGSGGGRMTRTLNGLTIGNGYRLSVVTWTDNVDANTGITVSFGSNVTNLVLPARSGQRTIVSELNATSTSLTIQLLGQNGGGGSSPLVTNVKLEDLGVPFGTSECLSDADCATNPNGTVCDGATLTCGTGSVADAGTDAGTGGSADAGTGSCAVDADCGSGNICDSVQRECQPAKHVYTTWSNVQAISGFPNTCGLTSSADFKIKGWTTGRVTAVANGSGCQGGILGVGDVTGSTNYPSDFYSPTAPVGQWWITNGANANSGAAGKGLTYTVTFDNPVKGLRFHAINQDNSSANFAQALARISGNNEFEVSGARVNNGPNSTAAANGGCEANNGSNPNGACGTIEFVGQLSSLTFDVTALGGDGWSFTLSLPEKPGYCDVDADCTGGQVCDTGANLCFTNPDSDDDGILDSVEGNGDADGDGTPNKLDLDSDDDGLPDAVERGPTATPRDTDSDGTPDYLDTDDDGDGIPTSVERAACGPTGPFIKSTNLSVNPSFEAGATGFTADALYTNNCVGTGEAQYCVTSNVSQQNAGWSRAASDGSNVLIVNYPSTSASVGAAFWRQTVSVKPNTYYDFSAFLTNVCPSCGSGPNVDPAFSFWVTENGGAPRQLGSSTGLAYSDGWREFGFDFKTGPTTTSLTFEMRTANYGFGGLDAAVDNIRLRLQLCDTDGDNVADYVSLDSDGDGILDSVEGTLDTDGDGAANYLDVDSDNDGILDRVESNGVGAQVDTDGDGILDRHDLDSDNDGLLDSAETAADADSDGTPNYRDLDSDNDGIADAREAMSGATINADGTVAGPYGTNGLALAIETAPGSGAVNYTANDQNSDGTPDYLSSDSDGDGIADNVEKGATGIPVDSDGDGRADYLDLDSDGDGIADAIERTDGGAGLADTDGDNTPDYLDLDSDGDGITDGAETANDLDSDGKGNWRDLDSDGDAIADRVEGTLDTDADSKPNYLDVDSDGDGIGDSVESNGTGTLVDTDADLLPDYLDTDSDADGILDSVEGTADVDGDGKGNWRDLDSDGDSISDQVETNSSGAIVNTDGDVTPDYLDTDSDADGILDSVEGTTDVDGDGKGNWRDVDSDGDSISDSIETNGTGTLVDTDGDTTPDYVDTDTDNDGILDSVETAADFDSDGKGNWRDLDSDNDGISDQVEGSIDTDADGKPNYLDLDSDGDGLTDFFETGGNGTLVDTDADGKPNYLDLDSDNDCARDASEVSINSVVAALPNANPNANCVANPTLNRCDTTTGTCTQGCRDDAGCGIGTLCNTTSALCVAGCRGTGGNGCPNATDICSSTTAAAGVCQADTDGDKLIDALEEQLGTDPTKADTDGDGIGDFVETDGGRAIDTDNDGTIDARDLDSDADGIADATEKGTGTTPVDTDMDGLPDYRDLDSDGDGYTDAVELAVDTDRDGTPDYIDLDSDADGVTDANELSFATNRISADTDGDGITDGVECGTGTTAIDTDKDGKIDALDLDSDGDTIPDAIEKGATSGTPVDSDQDGTPDFRDLDSDGDTIPDATEAGANGAQPRDTDSDGKPDYLDLDSDGDTLTDASETSTDKDLDGAGNYIDLDSDNDCVLDAVEAAAKSELDPTLPQGFVDNNCPAAAPTCDTAIGACVSLPPGVPARDTANLQGGGGFSSCSVRGGMRTGNNVTFLVLGGLVGLALLRRRRAA